VSKPTQPVVKTAPTPPEVETPAPAKRPVVAQPKPVVQTPKAPEPKPKPQEDELDSQISDILNRLK
jgi:hypothetical protein